jgi:hypothetical protein
MAVVVERPLREADQSRVVVIDGVVDEALSQTSAIPASVYVGSVAGAPLDDISLHLVRLPPARRQLPRLTRPHLMFLGRACAWHGMAWGPREGRTALRCDLRCPWVLLMLGHAAHAGACCCGHCYCVCPMGALGGHQPPAKGA